MKSSVALLAFALAFSSATFAAEETKNSEGKTTLKVEDAAGKQNKVDGNIDEEITNARMRAESGSKSKFSLSTSLGYTGGSLNRAFGKLRPNLAADPGIQATTSADIGLDARFRWSKSQSVTLGTSFGLNTPFQGDTSVNDRQFNTYDPNVGYNLVGKIGQLQTSAVISYALGTSNESRAIDLTDSAGISVSALKAWDNGLTTGLSLSTGYNFYSSKAGQNVDTAVESYGGDVRREWTLGLYPFAEYSFNDRYSARTVFGYFNWIHKYGDENRYRLLQSYVYQSIGVGISVTRDIYLYPNIQFVPDNIRSDFTNVAMSATLNVF